MAFSSYEEFRAAIADPSRRLEVVHPIVTSAASSGFALHIPGSKLWTTNANASAGGTLLNHLSANGSTLGGIGVPLRKPSVDGRSWYIYNIEVEHSAVSLRDVVLFDALWMGNFQTTSPVTVVGAPDLTRFTDGIGVLPYTAVKHSSSTTVYGGDITVTANCANDISRTFVSGEQKGSVTNSPIVLSWGVARTTLLRNTSSTLGIGGVKKITSLTIQYGSTNAPAALFLLAPLTTLSGILPMVTGETGNYAKQSPFMAASLFNGPLPFIRLAPGTDGNFACLLPVYTKGQSTALTASKYGSIRLQLVEG